MAEGITVQGQDRLLKHIKKMSNPSKVFNSDIALVARQGVRELAKLTPKRTGNTARAWTKPIKVGLSHYLVKNSVRTKPTKTGKRYNLIRLLNDGHEVISVTPWFLLGKKFVEASNKKSRMLLAKKMIATIRKEHGRNS